MANVTEPDVPWPSEFELELRAELAALRREIVATKSHQLRTDGLVMALQMEMRKGFNMVVEQLKTVATLIRASGANGHG